MRDRLYLLDTHIVMWMDREPQRISPELRRTMDASEMRYLSAASAWETAIKRGAGKLDMQAPISDAIERFELTALSVTIEHGEFAGSLPRHHGDQFDRLLVAQAMIENLVLVTADAWLKQYDVRILLV